LEYQQKILKYKGKVVFEKLSLPYFDGLMPKEYFENEACFIFVNEGEFFIRSQTEQLHLQKGAGLLAKCLNYFFETNKTQRSIGTGVEVIGLLLYPELVHDIFEFDLHASTHQVNYNLKKIEVNKLLEHFKESISILLDHPELADESLIKNKLREFVMLMSKTVEAPSELDFLASMFKPNFAKLEEVIQKNMFANLTLDELASLCHMSLSSFKRKFKEVYGDSPIKHLIKMKVEKAAEMLNDRNNRISDIAYDTGFESLTTFNRTFKARYGKSPSEYRLTLSDQSLGQSVK
jgi:AraC-like DNA-binding protein